MGYDVTQHEMPEGVIFRASKVVGSVGKGSRPAGEVPAIVLDDPKYDHNVAQVIRAASNFGLRQVWWTGNRVAFRDPTGVAKRLPREERMADYEDIAYIQYDYPFDQFPGAAVVGVELVPGAQNLVDFVHPENAVYVFGPEDGNIHQVTRRFCHQFVQIPSKHCLNLHAAVNVVLYDRSVKRIRSERGW